MDLLKYEFLDAPEGSYNAKLKELVSLIRHYKSNSPIDEFQKAVPSLQKIEGWLHAADKTMGESVKRNYIQEIMEELSQEDFINDNFLEEVERAAKSILKSVLNKEFSMTNVNFNFKNSEALSWIEYSQYNGNKEEQQIVKDVFQSICYKNGIVFTNKN